MSTVNVGHCFHGAKWQETTIVGGSLEVKLPTVWTDEKAEVGRVGEVRREAVRRSEKRKSEKKEEAGARKGREVAIHCVFFQ